MNTPTALLTALLGLSLAACGGHEVVRPTVDVSIGQQLIDLKRAREAGAMSDREYERQRKRLIDSVE
ncbi:MAG: hypothetical protein ACYC5W_17745 [Thauera sp.]